MMGISGEPDFIFDFENFAHWTLLLYLQTNPFLSVRCYYIVIIQYRFWAPDALFVASTSGPENHFLRKSRSN